MALPASHQRFARQLDLGTLHLFVLICQGGSIGAAAKQAHLAVSSVSKRIKELEDLAGSPLLSRHARGVAPTRAGSVLLRHAQGILTAVDHLHDDLSDFAQGSSGHVHVFASASAVEQFLAAELAEFAQSHANVSIDLSQVTSRDVIRAVRNGEADLGISDASDGSQDLQTRTYHDETLVLVVPAGHALAGAASLGYADALEYEQIGLQGSSMIQQCLEGAAREAGLALRQRIKVASLSAMCRMIESGLGVGVMPRGAMRQFAGRGKISAVALTDAWATRVLLLYARSFDGLSVAARRFADHLAPPRQP